MEETWTGFELTHRDSQFAMHFLKYAMQKSTKTTKITMQGFYAYFSHMLHVCYAYSSRMLWALLMAYILRILRVCCAYSSHMLRIILACIQPELNP